MDKVWKDTSEESKKYREWFINIGMGANIRKQKGLPISLTKKVAHYFLQAPNNVTVSEAIRWGQVIAMGGEERVARGIMTTPLRGSFENDDFWTTVIRFFIDNPFLDAVNYGPIYDYLQEKKFGHRRPMWVENRLVEMGPEQPNLSMKGRDPLRLLEDVNEWHVGLNRTNFNVYGGDCCWKSCGIPGFERKERGTLYQITELLDSRDLRDEGNAMGHCVASYILSCKEGRSAVYSMVRVEKGELTREATIEVGVEGRKVLQARKRFNAVITEEDKRIIGQWAYRANLKMSEWI